MRSGATRIEGLAELEAALRQLPKRATQKAAVRRALTKAAEPLKRTASELAPDDPRTPPIDLHTSIEISAKARGAKTSATGDVTVFVGPTMQGYPQAGMMEFGTFKDRPQPYLRPAWEREQQTVLARIGALLGAEIEKAAARLAKRNAKRGG